MLSGMFIMPRRFRAGSISVGRGFAAPARIGSEDSGNRGGSDLGVNVSVKVSDDVHPSDGPPPAPGFIVCVRVSGFIASTGSAGLVDELLLDVGRTYPP